jgi:hypothetical protein
VPLDAFQAEVARIALEAAAEHGFALAGGNALVAHGLVARDTHDVDLFSDQAGGPGAVTATVRTALEAAGYDVAVTRPPELNDGEFARLVVRRGNEGMQLDMARDWRKWPPVRLDVGPVLHLDDAVSSKVNAMVGRWAPRDFIDVAAAIDHGYSRPELMTLTFTRDPGLRVEDFTEAMRQLDQLQVDDFADYGFDHADLDALRQRFADWPRHEADDQEGQAVHAAVTDEERRANAGPPAATLAGQAYPSDATTRPPTSDAGSAVPPTPESTSHYRPRS